MSPGLDDSRRYAPGVADTDVLARVHPDLVRALTDASSTVRLASPFLSGGVCLELAHLARRSTASWSMLTTLDPHAIASGYLSTTGIRSLMGAGVSVWTLERLHAKTYLADDAGFIGSGNLTASGLGTSSYPNFELTVRLSHQQVLDTTAVLDKWCSLAAFVDEAALREAERRAAKLPVALAPPQSTGADLIAAHLLVDARTVKVWTKAVYGHWVEHDWQRADAFFASSKQGRPRFQVGDLALIYSRDEHACNAVVEVTTEAEYAPQVCLEDGWTEEDAYRWPWVNRVRSRLTVAAKNAVRPVDLGFSSQALEAGHREMNLAEFAAAVSMLSGRESAP